jgi:hypothetical protein
MGINLELPQESSMQSQHGMANSGLSTIGASNGFGVQLRAKRVRCNAWFGSSMNAGTSPTSLHQTNIVCNYS